MTLFSRVARRLDEGTFDQHQYRAILMGGGMGSGKSWVNQQMFGSATGTATTDLGLKSISVDDVFLHKAKKAGEDPQTVLYQPKGQAMHFASREPTVKRQMQFANQGLGLVIDGTGQDPKKILDTKAALEKLGYDVSMVMVKTDQETALKRNRSRGREVPDELVRGSHEKVAAAIPKYKEAFGDDYHEIENSSAYTPEEVKKEIAPKLRAKALAILEKPLKNPIGRAKLDDEIKSLPAHMAKKVAAIKDGKLAKPQDIVTRVGRIKDLTQKMKRDVQRVCKPGEHMTFGVCRKVGRKASA